MVRFLRQAYYTRTPILFLEGTQMCDRRVKLKVVDILGFRLRFSL